MRKERERVRKERERDRKIDSEIGRYVERPQRSLY